MAEITKKRQTVASFFRLIRNGASTDAKSSGTTLLESNNDICSSIFGWSEKCTYESKPIKVNKIIVLVAVSYTHSDAADE